LCNGNSLTLERGQLKDVIQDLYQIMIQVSAYDLAGKPGKDVLENAMYVPI
jgi:hypothetical protein